MYEIYINDLPLVIHPSAAIPEEFADLPEKGADDRALLESLYDLLKNPRQGMRISSDDPEALFYKFKTGLKVIPAAGGVVFNRQQEILLIRRLGKWDLPKGKVDAGESIEHAAIREVQEECSIYELTLGKPAGITYHVYELKGRIVLKETHWFFMDYTGNALPRPQVEESITEAGWFKKNAVQALLHDTYASLRRLLADVTK